MTDSDDLPRIDSSVSDADADTVRKGLGAFNALHAPREPTAGPVRFVVRDESGRVVGGVLGATVWGWLDVATLWVDEAHRGRGLGARLLRAAEHEARARGCTYALLDTFSFQAPDFYRRMGYEQFGALRDFPRGQTRYFLTKRLIAES